MKKRQIREFQMFVDTYVPKFLVNSTETHILSGKELLEWGFTHDPDHDNVPIDPAKIYKYKQPVQTEVDHVRRIRRAYQSNGKEGIDHYLGSIARRLQKKT